MPIVEVVKLKASLAPGGRLLGLDAGSKSIGLAISDSGLRVASPLTTIRRTKFAADAKAICQIVSERSVGGLIIGLPIGIDGREGPRCQSVRQFTRNLLAVIDLPAAFWDERYSTIGVERHLREA